MSRRTGANSIENRKNYTDNVKPIIYTKEGCHNAMNFDVDPEEFGLPRADVVAATERKGQAIDIDYIPKVSIEGMDIIFCREPELKDVSSEALPGS